MGKPPLAADQDKFVLRLPNGMRERIKAIADRNGRSMNAEIVQTLENAYPEPISLEEVVSDIQETIKIIKRFKGTNTLMVLADNLDQLMLDIARSQEGTAEDRADAMKHVEEHGKFIRFVPPDDRD